MGQSAKNTSWRFTEPYHDTALTVLQASQTLVLFTLNDFQYWLKISSYLVVINLIFDDT